MLEHCVRTNFFSQICNYLSDNRTNTRVSIAELRVSRQPSPVVSVSWSPFTDSLKPRCQLPTHSARTLVFGDVAPSIRALAVAFDAINLVPAVTAKPLNCPWNLVRESIE